MKNTDYADLVNVVQEEAGTTFREAREIVALVRAKARRLQRISERQCNGYPVFEAGRIVLGWDAEASAKDEARAAKIESQLVALGDTFGIRFDTSGDPRGYVVKLKTPKTGRYNTMGGAEAGWGIE